MNRTPPRMPTFEELPLPGQAEYRARQGASSEHEPEKRRVGLLQRLAAVGLGGRRDDVFDGRGEARSGSAPATRTEPRGRDPGSRDSGNRDAGNRDMAKMVPPEVEVRGRAVAAPPPGEDDQLDIPAFLRRQANM